MKLKFVFLLYRMIVFKRRKELMNIVICVNQLPRVQKYPPPPMFFLQKKDTGFCLDYKLYLLSRTFLLKNYQKYA